MSLPSLPDFDALWDYSHPDRTELKFREVLLQFPEGDPGWLELLTQIGRAQGLQRRFEQAHQTLDQVERRLGEVASRPRLRYLLERGRVFNSAGRPAEARPWFEQALAMGRQLGEEFYAVDALHMLAILAPPEESLALNRQAIAMAETASEEKARGWLGSLYNNTGWAFHDMGDYTAALETFEKAEAWQRAHGSPERQRIAAWCVGRALRSLGRADEALARQMALKHEGELAGERDGYVFEEIGECLLALGRPEEARPFFLTAYEILSRDAGLAEQEPERLARLQSLGST